MARIDRLIVPTVTVFPLEIPTQLIQQRSSYPRAVVDVNAPLEAVAPAGSGNTLQIYQDISLPKNFAYLYLGATVTLSHLSESQMTSTFVPYQTIFGNAGTSVTWVSRFNSNHQLNDNATHGWAFYSDPINQYTGVWSDNDSAPKDVMFNDKSESVRIKTYLYNNANSTTSTSFMYSYKARFLQVDLSQAYSFAINNTIATR
tara:strand:- start:86 stop:691 length:606 start_codon:yes stop_codon:yes gene_type:complete